MKIEQVAVILYTVRAACKTRQDLAASLKKIRDIGYRAIQISGLDNILPAGDLKKMVADNGLAACSTHEDSDRILNHPDLVADKLNQLGIALTAYPAPRGFDLSRGEAVDELIRKLDAAGRRLKQAGITLMYHNHAFEFARLGAKTVLEQILDRVPAEHMQAELDTYWVQYGGGDPAAWCRALPNRLPALHLKDVAFSPTDGKPVWTEIGNGNLDLKDVIGAAESSGCQWFIVEQDTCPGDPFDSIRKSFEYIQENLAA